MPEGSSTVAQPGTVDGITQRGSEPEGSFRRTLVQDCGHYALSQGSVVVNGLVLIPTITHLFPPAVYGDYVLCSSVINLGMLLLSGWLTQGTLRFYPIFERDGRQQFFLDGTATVAILSAVVAALLGAAAMLVVGGSIRAELAHLLWFTLPVMVAYSLFSASSTYLRSARLLSLFTRTRVAGAIVQPALGLLTLLVWRDIRAYFIVWLLSLCGLNVWIWLALKPRPFWLRKLREFSTGQLFAYGFPLVLSQLLTQVLLFADRYILEAVRTPREVGIYSLGFTIGQMPMNLLFTVLMSAVYPLIVRSWERDPVHEAVRNIRLGIRYYLLVGVPSVVGLSLLSRNLVAVLGSKDYSSAAGVVPWVAASFFLSGLAQFPLLHAQLRKRPAIQTWVMAFAAGENVVINLLFIPRYGYYGAAVALLLSMVIVNIVGWIIGARLIPVSFPLASLGRCLAGSAIMAVSIWSLMSIDHSAARLWCFGVILPATLVYVGSLYLLGEFEPSERKLLRQLLRRMTLRREPIRPMEKRAEIGPYHGDRRAPRPGEETSI